MQIMQHKETMTSHNLLRLSGTIWNVPQLITQEAFAPILDYLSDRNLIGLSANVAGETKKAMPSGKAGSVGEIKVDSTLTYRPVESMCGPAGTSYQGILQQAEQLIAEGVTTLIMTHSSPGGSAAHCFSTANELRAMCDENDITLITYIDEMSASAALALGVVADEVIIHPSASTGSIGCVVAIADMSKAYEMEGVKPIYISSTPGKTPFQNDGSFSQSFLDKIQEDVTRLGTEFAAHVSKYTGVTMEDILAMDAQMFHAEAALEAGLVNKIMDHTQFTAYVAGLNKGARK